MPYTAYPVWPFPPNWADGVLERLEWKTDILQGDFEVEQRIPRRLTPRRTLEANFVAYGRSRQLLDSFLNAHSGKVFVVPLWYELSQLTAQASAGTDTLQVDTRWREFTVGELVLIKKASAEVAWEVGTVESLTDSSITLVGNLEGTWPANSLVYPARKARLVETNFKAQKKTDRAFLFRAQIQIQQANPHDAFFYTEDDYRGWSIYTTRPDESEDLTLEYLRILHTLDNELGIPSVIDPSGQGAEIAAYRWAFRGAQKAYELRKLLHYLCGRKRGIWVPTFMQDMELSSPLTAFSNIVQIKNIKYAVNDARREGRKDIYIALQGGQVLTRRIVAAVETSAEVETLSLDAPVFYDVPINEVQYISFLAPRRLAQDTVELDHRADIEGLTVCNVQWMLHTQPSFILTSKPYPVSMLDSMESVGAVAPTGKFIIWPIDDMGAFAAVEASGTLRAPLVLYTTWPFDALDAYSGIETTGTLRNTLLFYTNWPFDAMDVYSSIESTGTIRVALLLYTNWPFDAMDTFGGIEPTGTLA